jgi:hypothetical protein
MEYWEVVSLYVVMVPSFVTSLSLSRTCPTTNTWTVSVAVGRIKQGECGSGRSAHVGGVTSTHLIDDPRLSVTLSKTRRHTELDSREMVLGKTMMFPDVANVG